MKGLPTENSGGAVTATHKQLTDFHKAVTRYVPQSSHVSLCMFIHNKPSGLMVQLNRQDKYSFDTDSLAPVCLLIRSHRCPIVPLGQPDHRSTKGPVSHYVARPQSTNKPRTASETRPQNKRHTIHGARLHSQARPHCRRQHCFGLHSNWMHL